MRIIHNGKLMSSYIISLIDLIWYDKKKDVFFQLHYLQPSCFVFLFLMMMAIVFSLNKKYKHELALWLPYVMISNTFISLIDWKLLIEIIVIYDVKEIVIEISFFSRSSATNIRFEITFSVISLIIITNKILLNELRCAMSKKQRHACP